MFYLALVKIIAGILFLYLTWRNLAEDYHEERLISYSWLALLAFLVLGRATFGVIQWGIWNDNPSDWLTFWTRPGFNLSGGLVGMCLASVWYTQANNWKLWQFLEEMTEVVCLFVAIGLLSELSFKNI